MGRGDNYPDTRGKLLTDLKEARERLKQISPNSSRPPSSNKTGDNC
ncbi:MAG: DUF6444 domain-containing protein [Methylococcaceae bacterium]